MQPQIAPAAAMDSSTAHADGIPLTVSTAHSHETTILSVDGDLDLLTAPALSEAVNAALAVEPRRLIIDLTNTAFLASAGMRVLLAAAAAIEPAGHLTVVAQGPATERPMKLVGLDEKLTIVPTLDEAVATSPESIAPAPIRHRSQTQNIQLATSG